MARRKLLAGGVMLAGSAASAVSPQRLPALPTTICPRMLRHG